MTKCPRILLADQLGIDGRLLHHRGLVVGHVPQPLRLLCRGRNPPSCAAKCPARPYESAIERRFTMANNVMRLSARSGPDRPRAARSAPPPPAAAARAGPPPGSSPARPAPPAPASIAPRAISYDAFGDNRTPVRELELETPIFCGTAVRKSPNASEPQRSARRVARCNLQLLLQLGLLQLGRALPRPEAAVLGRQAPHAPKQKRHCE